MDINFKELKELADRVSINNGKYADKIIISKKLYNKYPEFQTDTWEGLKIEVYDNEDEREIIYVR